MQKKYNNDNYFTIKQFIFFFVVIFSFLILLIWGTIKLGIEGQKDVEEKEEQLRQEQEAAKYYSINIDKDLFKKGFVVYNKEVYYYVSGTKIMNDENIGNLLCECELDNLKIQDDIYEYKVKDGYKYKNTVGGELYSCKNNDDIVYLLYDYKTKEWENVNCYMYVKAEVYEEFIQKSIKEIHKNGYENIDYIYFESDQKVVPHTSIGKIEIEKLFNSFKDFEYNFLLDNLELAYPSFYTYKMYIVFDNNIAYEYEAMYKVKNKTLYILEYLDENTCITYGLSADENISFIKEIR